MPIPVVVPRLGWTMEQGVFVEWLKRDGDFIQMGDPLFVLEGEKATQDIESTDVGILKIPANSPKSGDIIAVGATIGYLLAEGEAWHDEASRIPTRHPGLATQSMTVVALSETNILVQEFAQTDAAHSNSTSSNSNCSNSTCSEDASGVQCPSTPIKITISPRALRIARELGVDWTLMTGSGSSGRIRESDIRAFKNAMSAAVGNRIIDDSAQTSSGLSPSSPAARIPVKLPPLCGQNAISRGAATDRRTIAEHLLEGARSTAAVTLTTQLDATNLVSLQQQFQAAATSGEVVPSDTDVLVKLAAIALKQHPDVNSFWDEQSNVIRSEESHIGIGVDTPAGLLVPVIRSVGRLTLRQIAIRTRELIERTRQRTLSQFELRGGTFTITNMGMYGVESFTPLLNPPQAAILGVGQITREPVVVGDQIVARDRLILCLTFDHRILDGAPAARFLNTLSNLIANPVPALIS